MIIGKFVKQYKGKDLDKVPESKLDMNGYWYVGIKYDGNYVQIHKKDDKILMFTSGGEPFCVEEICKDLLQIKYDFIIEAEFLNNCDGTKLNDRNFCSTATARANFKKKIKTSMPNSSIRIFDILNFNDVDIRDITFNIRNSIVKENFDLRISKHVKLVDFYKTTYGQSISFSRELIHQGGEGAFAFNSEHTIFDKGRSNLAIKLKDIKVSFMVCKDVEASKTVNGEYGSLILEDSFGNKNAFGGLTKKLRTSKKENLIGKIFKVKYENFVNNKYIQGFIVG